MKNVFIVFLFLINISCQNFNSGPEFSSFDSLNIDIVPKPVLMDTTWDSFALEGLKSYSVSSSGDHKLAGVVDWFQQMTEIQLTQKTEDAALAIELKEAYSDQIEAYDLEISSDKIVIRSGSEEGLARGMQTLAQLIMLQYFDYLPVTIVTDQPQYAYRGMMLDVARHFFTVEEVKTLIDYLALYKINHLHLHLSDDQGWRIEIKSWPKLTEIGGSSEVGGGEGGYYTQDDFREIVEYAKSRFITIVPEIDMPGHTNAALASYPELNCDDNAPDLYTGTRVGFSTLCTGKEITYKFINDVIEEIIQIADGPYFHIGGDESHVTPHEDYLYFINRVSQIVRSKGRKMIGWDEIAQAAIGDSAVVQFWTHKENAVKAAEKNSSIIYSLANVAYMDMKYDSQSEFGLNWAGTIELDKSYNWSPSDSLRLVKDAKILGIEAPLWSETISDLNEAEYLIFPRLLSYAEIGWTPDSLRNWDSFASRVEKHQMIFDSLDINYYPTPKINWK